MFKRWLRSVLRSMLLRTFRLIADPYRHPLSRFQRSETNYFLSASVTLATVPRVSSTRSSKSRRNTEFGVPAAAQISSKLRKSSSMMMSTGSECPIGGTPPMAKPVRSRTKPALARSIASPRWVAMIDFTCSGSFRSDDYHGSIADVARNTNDFAICPTVQPIAAAASAAERVDASNSITSKRGPSTPGLAAQCDAWLVSLRPS